MIDDSQEILVNKCTKQLLADLILAKVVVPSVFSLLADALLQGSSVHTGTFKSVVRITNRNISAPRIARDKFETSICSIFSAVLLLLLHFSLALTFPCHFLFCC